MRNLLQLPSKKNLTKKTILFSQKRNSLSVKFIKVLLLLIAFLPVSFLFGQTTITYPSTTTWACPTGVYSIIVECWGGGGAGGGATGNPSAGGGGAGGSYVKNIALAVTPGTIYTITVGTGGTGNSTSSPGNPGNDSWFSSAATILAKGGLGGARATAGNQTAVGASAISSGNVGFTAPASSYSFYGGAGGTGGASGASGGGGGSSAGTGSNGNGASGITGGSAVTGGGAGVNGSASSADGANNTNLGGGGAGGRAGSGTDRKGGSGGNGQVKITFTQPSCPASTAVTPAATQTFCSGSAANILTATITLAGASGTPALLYQWYYNNANSNNIGTATLIAGETNQTYTAQNTVIGTRYYFCVGYSTNNSCNETNATQSLASNTVQVNVTGLSGTYLVGTGQTYTTLTAAIAAYNSTCLAGPVTFALTNATYAGSETFPITINSNASASATNTLTIKPNTGNTATISGSLASNALIRILGNHVIINGSNNGSSSRNLTITNTNTTGPSVVLIGSTGTTPINNVTLKNSTIINGANTATAIVISDATILGAAGYFSDVTIQNNSIQKAYMGIYSVAVNVAVNGSGLLIDGNDLATSGGNAIRRVGIYVQDIFGATISNNNIGNFENASTEFDYGIWFASGTKNSEISGNTISNLNYSGAFNTGPSGIFISTNTYNSFLTVFNNTITGISSTGWVPVGGSGAANGINIDFASAGGVLYGNKISNIKNTNGTGYGCSGIQLSATAVDANFTIYNNFIWDVASKGSTTTRSYDKNGHGIVITTGGGYHIYNNTVLMNTNQSNNGYPSAMNITAGVTNPASIDIKNNLFVNTQTQAGERYAIQSDAANTVYNAIDYNNYYTTGTNLGYIGSNRTNLAAIQTGFGSNTNSLNILPVFFSSTDLHLQAPIINEALNGMGTAVATITTDIDGQLRNVFTPDMGADEFKGRGSWVGTTSTSWTTASNWFENFIPTPSTHVEVGPATYFPIIPSGTVAINNVVVQPGGSLTINGTGVFQIGGKISNTGTFDVSDGTVELNGTVAQAIPANTFQTNSIKNLIISNTDNVTGVTLGGSTDIYSSLTFGAGGKKLTTGDFLTFKSTATQTAWLGQMSGSNTIVGDATVERYIPLHAKAWQFLAAPTSGQTVNQAWQEGNSPLSAALNPAYGTIITNNVAGTGFDLVGGTASSMKTFDTTTKAWVGIANTTIPIYNRKGYMLFVRGNRTVTSTIAAPTFANLRTKGTLFTPANPPAVINLAANTFESVGNPFASAIDLTTLAISGGVQDLFYVWDPNVTTSPSPYGLGAYQTFSRNGATYDVTPGGGSYPSGTCKTIQSGQAFLVRAPLTAGSLTFSESNKVSGSSNVTRLTQPVTSQLRTNLYVMASDRSVLLDGTLVQFDQNFSNTVDMLDAVKLGNTGENLGIKRNGQTLAVERRNSIQNADTIAYTLGMLRVQQYMFELIPKGIEQEGLEAFLEDNYLHTSTVVNLSGTTNVLFNIINVPGSYAANRFRLVFKQKKKLTLPVTVATADAGKANIGLTDAAAKGTSLNVNSNKPSVTVYPNPVVNKNMQVQFMNLQTGTYNIELTNNSGQLVYSSSVQLATVDMVKSLQLDKTAAAGAYQLTITGANGYRSTQQVIIQ